MINDINNHYDLVQLAKQVMQYRGLEPVFSDEAIKQVDAFDQPAPPPSTPWQDLRSLLWCSIDNDDSRDLDQLTYAEKISETESTVWVAVADVSALVIKDSPVDLHAQVNTTSVYTPAIIFPMLPEKLSTNLTSLNENEDRMALVIKMRVNTEGEIGESSIQQAYVRNHAKLAYSFVGDWLEGKIPLPDKIASIEGLEKALKYQNEVAQNLKRKRHAMGALTLESSEVEAKVIKGDGVQLQKPVHNLAHQLIEHFMIAANTVLANSFRAAKIPSLRRVVKIPSRWEKIVEIAGNYGTKLPEEPDSKALDSFLVKRKAEDPETFPDLSLTIIKLMGRGEYIVEYPDQPPTGHFGLALSEYSHTTAPNRRLPDLISQRMYKAYLSKTANPYSQDQLQLLADHCTKQEDAAKKVERHLTKSAAALLLKAEIGEVFDGVITGATDQGTWIRIFQPPVEGRVVRGYKGLDVGDRASVKLISVDVEKGYIDFIIERERQ